VPDVPTAYAVGYDMASLTGLYYRVDPRLDARRCFSPTPVHTNSDAGSR